MEFCNEVRIKSYQRALRLMVFFVVFVVFLALFSRARRVRCVLLMRFQTVMNIV